jgi:hypothetical protein
MCRQGTGLLLDVFFEFTQKTEAMGRNIVFLITLGTRYGSEANSVKSKELEYPGNDC